MTITQKEAVERIMAKFHIVAQKAIKESQLTSKLTDRAVEVAIDNCRYFTPEMKVYAKTL